MILYLREQGNDIVPIWEQGNDIVYGNKAMILYPWERGNDSHRAETTAFANRENQGGKRRNGEDLLRFFLSMKQQIRFPYNPWGTPLLMSSHSVPSPYKR